MKQKICLFIILVIMLCIALNKAHEVKPVQLEPFLPETNIINVNNSHPCSTR